MSERKEGGIPQDQEETIEAFKSRVEERTGMKFEDIPQGVAEDLQGGQILCKRGEVYVVTKGYPKETDPETSIEIFDDFRVVDLSKWDGHSISSTYERSK